MSEEKYKELLKENYNKVLSLCLRYFGNRTEAEDAAQDVFVKVWVNYEKFRGDAAVSTWIYRIAANVCLTALRNRKNQHVEIESVKAEKSDEDDSDHLSRQETGEEKLRFFNEYMKKLSSMDKTIVSLYLEDVDSKAISEITGLSDANIRTRIHRIKNGIKKEWEESHGA